MTRMVMQAGFKPPAISKPLAPAMNRLPLPTKPLAVKRPLGDDDEGGGDGEDGGEENTRTAVAKPTGERNVLQLVTRI